tara:strand:- start:253 stop:519 length:267 start_codon:yes stop_codon:yes gene_type:complete
MNEAVEEANAHADAKTKPLERFNSQLLWGKRERNTLSVLPYHAAERIWLLRAIHRVDLSKNGEAQYLLVSEAHNCSTIPTVKTTLSAL